MNYKELIEQLRYESGPVARDEAADAIESLLAENERLNHNLTSTEQTMREYQELAAKRLEKIAKYRDAPVVAWSHLVKGLTFVETYAGSKPPPPHRQAGRVR